MSTLTEYLLPVKCALNKQTNQVIHIVGNNTEAKPDELDPIEENVTLSLNIHVFLDADYKLPLKTPANDLKVGTPLFVRLELDKQQLPAKGTKLFVTDCVGKPEADTTDASRIHYIIKDSCPDDDSADFNTQSELHRVQFKFETFKFGLNNDKLYLTCYAIICPPGDTSSGCRPKCSYPQHPHGAYSSSIRSKRYEGDSGEAIYSSDKPPQSMNGGPDQILLKNPDVTEDWPLNPTGDVTRTDSKGRVYTLSNNGRLLRCKNCKNDNI